MDPGKNVQVDLRGKFTLFLPSDFLIGLENVTKFMNTSTNSCTFRGGLLVDILDSRRLVCNSDTNYLL